MRIGEVAIVSHKSHDHEAFILSVCQKIDVKNEQLCFGRFEVNDHLALHLYGIGNNVPSSSLDLLSRKTLGFIIIFDWEDKKILELTRATIDHFSSHFKAPIIIVGSIKNKKDPPIPDSFFRADGIPLSSNCRLTFAQVDDPESARNVMVLLINMLIEQLS